MKRNRVNALPGFRLDNRGAALITVVAVFAVISVLAASLTSLVYSSAKLTNERAFKTQAYLTAKSVLNVTVKHIEDIAGNRAEVSKFVGKSASGSLENMGSYTANIEWEGTNAVKITVTGSFNRQSASLDAIVSGIEGGA